MFSDTNMGWDVGDYPPFSMLGARFASERDALPLPDLWLTLGIGAGLGLFGISLALVREGGVARWSSQKMGHRRKGLHRRAARRDHLHLPDDRRKAGPGAIRIGRIAGARASSPASRSTRIAWRAARRRRGTRRLLCR
ncbi:MAG: hypothetical protein R3F11_23770 [Verrucomicrobiales bacterium]